MPVQAVERVKPDAVDTAGRPLDPSLPKDYQARFQALLQKPDFVDTIFAHIANGGTLITLAETWGVRHSDLANYIGSTPELKERHRFAMTMRDEWEKERCIQELRAIMTCDIRDAYDENGALKNVKDLPPTLAAALSNLETEELYAGEGEERHLIGFTRKVKFWDKAKAIELFMKKHGLLVERVKVQTARTLEDLIGAANAEIVDAEIVPQGKSETENAEGVGVSGVLVSKHDSV